MLCTLRRYRGAAFYAVRGRPRVSTARLRGRNQVVSFRNGAETNRFAGTETGGTETGTHLVLAYAER